MRVRDIVIGERYKDILVIGPKYRKNGATYYGCKCMRCGKVYEMRNDHIGRSRCCSDCFPKDNIVDLSGKRFGRLIALEYVGRKNNRTLWKCRCDCGNESIAGYSNLVNGITRSCGCLEKENLAYIQKHSCHRKSASREFEQTLSEHPLYGLWSSMLTRCYNKSRNSYKHYGGRGIKVCDRWLPENKGFENFLNDMGPRPSLKHTIDRIDVNGDYCPENCRWATIIQQSNNKTDSVLVYYMGRRVYLKDICKKLRMNYSTVAHQLLKGFDINVIIANGGADFRRKVFRGNTDQYKNFNKNITIFVPEIESDGTEIEGKE